MSKPRDEIDSVLAAQPKPSHDSASTPRVRGRYIESERTEIAKALGWQADDPRLPEIVEKLEAASVWLPLDRGGRQGRLLAEIGKVGTRLVVLLGDLSDENRRAIKGKEAQAVIEKLKNRALAAKPGRGPQEKRKAWFDYIEPLARTWQEATGRPTICWSRDGKYGGDFLRFVRVAARPFAASASDRFLGGTIVAWRKVSPPRPI